MARFLVRERDRGPGTGHTFDVALVWLETPFPASSVACLDLGAPPNLQALTTGDRGVVSATSSFLAQKECTEFDTSLYA